jgi:hypothetical protein
MLITVLFTLCTLCVDNIPTMRNTRYDIKCSDISNPSHRNDCLAFQKEMTSYFTSFEIEEFVLTEIASNNGPGTKYARVILHIPNDDYFEFLGKIADCVFELTDRQYQATPSEKIIFKWETIRKPTVYDKVKYNPITQSLKNTAFSYFMDAKAFLENSGNVETGQKYMDIMKGYWNDASETVMNTIQGDSSRKPEADPDPWFDYF